MKRRPPQLDQPYPKHRPASEEELHLWFAAVGDDLSSPKTDKRLARQSETARTKQIVPSAQDKVKITISSRGEKEPLLPQAVDAPTRKKILRGRMRVEATLDLHGYSRVTGHAALVRFIEAAQVRGVGLALVITGKGNEGKPGILREELPRWLEGPPLRGAIIAYDAAGLPHGGGGAWYVRIRKRATER